MRFGSYGGKAQRPEMACPRVNINGQFYRLRETGKATFEPEAPEEFKSQNGRGPSSRFVVCLSTHNVEARVDDELDKLQTSLAGCGWRLLAGDNGSTDSTAERVRNWCERASVPHVFYQFEHEPDGGRAMHRLAQLATIYESSQCKVIALALDAPQTRHRIKSFSLVATSEVKAEAAILVRSLRTFHPEPVFVWGDKATRDFIKKHGDTGVEFRDGASKPKLNKLLKEYREKVVAPNDFHRVDCIAAKMDAWQWAISEAGDSLFLDADIVAVANLNDGLDRELVLSPHWHGTNDGEAARKFGLFNAGYLWSNTAAAPEFWREIYCGRSAFYEQEGMALFAERFKLGLFPPTHNVGFWRDPDFNITGIKSYHVHMTAALDPKCNEGLRNKYIEHRQRVANSLELLGRHDLLDFIGKVQ